MRHLGSIVLAIVFAPLMFLLAGYGQVRFVVGFASYTRHWSDVSIGIAAILVAAALYSILVMTRISPLGPILAALAFIAAEIWALLDQASLVKLLGTSVLGTHGAQEAPLTGLALFMAIPLLATVVSARRWRGDERAATPGDNNDAAPTYGTPISAAPVYAPLQTTEDTAANNDPETSDADEEKAADAEEAKAGK